MQQRQISLILCFYQISSLAEARTYLPKDVNSVRCVLVPLRHILKRRDLRDQEGRHTRRRDDVLLNTLQEVPPGFSKRKFCLTSFNQLVMKIICMQKHFVSNINLDLLALQKKIWNRNAKQLQTIGIIIQNVNFEIGNCYIINLLFGVSVKLDKFFNLLDYLSSPIK